jgi:hypothetical protein
MDDGEVTRLELEFPKKLLDELRLLEEPLGQLKTYRCASPINGGGIDIDTSCIWGKISIYALFAACLIGCPSSGPFAFPCWAACFTGAAAALAAINENKSPAVA